jgi:hypothetical protein
MNSAVPHRTRALVPGTGVGVTTIDDGAVLDTPSRELVIGRRQALGWIGGGALAPLLPVLAGCLGSDESGESAARVAADAPWDALPISGMDDQLSATHAAVTARYSGEDWDTKVASLGIAVR